MSLEKPTPETCFMPFQSDISQFEIPAKFTFPFSYEPLPITLKAVKEVQAKLQMVHIEDAIAGKMFGVLVVKNQANALGYLTAFSGQLGAEKYPLTFVPAIFDRLGSEGFFKKGEEELIAINQQIEAMESAPDFLQALSDLEKEVLLAETEIANRLKEKQEAKKARGKLREEAKRTHSATEFEALDKKLKGESTNLHYEYKKLRIAWDEKLTAMKAEVKTYQDQIDALKAKRKAKSGELHQKIFDQYQFLNQYREAKGLSEIFTEFPQPPAGAGDCAAPKLLQYAFQHGFIPITLAEFWWGKTPKSEIRQQGKYYPACHSRCRPILKHMLQDIPLDDDPLHQYSGKDKVIETIYEDEHLLVINKPPGLLSVPSKEIQDSVLIRMQQQHPQEEGLQLVHRLDQLTSGLLIVAKSMEVYKAVQSQFIQRTISKQYIAILEGVLTQTEGVINLPLTTDFERKPLQKICHETGKPSRTIWKVLSEENGRTRIQFKPITGRTHQLRVHAAHQEGLNTPIVGDVLYGQKDERLLLHAEMIGFKHPISNKKMKFRVEAEF